jgi:hypothetical protein
MRSSISPGPTDERRHPSAASEEWLFTAWGPGGAQDGRRVQPATGLISGYRIVGDNGWYWAALARAGEPLLHVADWQVPLRSNPLLVKGDRLWAEHTCDAPMEQWTVANETYAAALDDPDDAIGRAYGVPTALSWDLEWYAIAEPRAVTSGYEQAGVVHGVIEIGGAASIHLEEAPAHRWHRWGAQLSPVELREAFAHTGLRAPFAFPDQTTIDWVLTPDGWRLRRGDTGADL